MVEVAEPVEASKPPNMLCKVISTGSMTVEKAFGGVYENCKEGVWRGSHCHSFLLGGDGAIRKVYKSLELDMSEDKIFILYNKRNDLDFLKVWTDQIDARAEVASSIEQTVAQTVESELNARQADTQTKERKAKIYSASMTNLTLNGLMKEADYWIKTRTPKTDVKTPEKLSDYDIEYTYYVVFSIDKTKFDRQVTAAMDEVPDNDDQTKFLKEVLTKKLKESIITNKDPEVIDFKNAKVEEVDDGINGVR